jgi:hypothetical protein
VVDLLDLLDEGNLMTAQDAKKETTKQQQQQPLKATPPIEGAAFPTLLAQIRDRQQNAKDARIARHILRYGR